MKKQMDCRHGFGLSVEVVISVAPSETTLAVLRDQIEVSNGDMGESVPLATYRPIQCQKRYRTAPCVSQPQAPAPAIAHLSYRCLAYPSRAILTLLTSRNNHRKPRRKPRSSQLGRARPPRRMTQPLAVCTSRNQHRSRSESGVPPPRSCPRLILRAWVGLRRAPPRFVPLTRAQLPPLSCLGMLTTGRPKRRNLRTLLVGAADIASSTSARRLQTPTSQRSSRCPRDAQTWK